MSNQTPWLDQPTVRPASNPVADKQEGVRSNTRQSDSSARKSDVDANRVNKLLPYDARKSAADATAAEAGLPYVGRSAAAKAIKDEADARTAQANADKAESESQNLPRRAAEARKNVYEMIQQYKRNIRGQPASRAFGYAERFDRDSAFGLVPPIPAYAEFTALGDSIIPLIRRVINPSATEGNSVPELYLINAYVPQASDSDEVIEGKIARLDRLLTNVMSGKPAEQITTGELGEKSIDQVETDILRDAARNSGDGPPNVLPEFAPENNAQRNPESSPDGLASMPRMPDVWRQGDAPQDLRLGDKTFVRDTELRVTAQLQQAFDNGASAEKMQELAKALYGATGINASLDPAKLEANIRYRDEFLRNGGVGPSGATIAPRETPVGEKEQNTLESLSSAPKAFAREYGDAASLGLGPDITGLFNPERAQAMRFTRGRMRAESPWASAAGDFLGSIGPTSGLTAGATRLGVKPAAAALIGDVVYNTARGATEDPEHRLSGAFSQGTMALLGGTAGRWTGAAPLEALGRKYVPGTPPKPSRADEILVNDIGNIGLAEQRLREAIDLGLPYGLADTTLEAQKLANRAARKGERAAEIADTVYPERLQERGNRAVQAIDDYISPNISNVRAREDDIKAAAQRAAGPKYDVAFSEPVVADETLSKLLDTHYGRGGLKRVLAEMEAEGVDPYAYGITKNAQGEPVAQKELSWETLHRIRMGVSDELDSFRHEITRKLVDSETKGSYRPWQGFLHRLDARLDTLNPAYKDARETYAKYMQPMDYLHNGLNAGDSHVPRADVEHTLARISKMPDETPEEIALRDAALQNYREGYATNRRRAVDIRPDNADAYSAIADSRLQREKLRLIGVNSNAFDQQLGAEQRMAVTAGATRDAVSKHADTNAQAVLEGMDVVDALGNAFGGVPGANLSAIARNVAYRPVMWKRGREALGWGIPSRLRKTADEIAPELMGNDPEAALNALLARQKSIEEYAKFSGPVRATSTILGGTLAGVTGRQAPDEPAPYFAPRPLDQNLLVAGVYGPGSKINTDGSVTTRDGNTIDAATVQQQVGETAQALSKYYDAPKPAAQALDDLASRYPQAPMNAAPDQIVTPDYGGTAPPAAQVPGLPPGWSKDPVTGDLIAPDGTHHPATVSPVTGR